MTISIFLRQLFQAERPLKNILEVKMNKNQNKTKNNVNLDPYESEILEAYETGKLIPAEPDINFQTIAKNTMKMNKKINIRIADNDLSALKRRAAREGIPYQTLIRSVLHKYASGFLKDSFNA